MGSKYGSKKISNIIYDVLLQEKHKHKQNCKNSVYNMK